RAKTAPKSDSAKLATAASVRIDFDGIDQRILALPIPARNYVQLSGGKAGALFLLEGLSVPTSVDPNGATPPAATVYRFNLEQRKLEKMLDRVARRSRPSVRGDVRRHHRRAPVHLWRRRQCAADNSWRVAGR